VFHHLSELDILVFRGLKAEPLDHKTREVVKSDLPKCEGRFVEVFCGCRFPEREIEEPVRESSSGQRNRAILCAWTSNLRVGRAVLVDMSAY
jgi:hypothetical protein